MPETLSQPGSLLSRAKLNRASPGDGNRQRRAPFLPKRRKRAKFMLARESSGKYWSKHGVGEMNRIPVIDIGPFLNGSAKDQETVARQVDHACSSIGFLIISGHGVPDSLIDDMLTVSRAYFDQPLEEKVKLRMPPDRYRGYILLGSEALSYSLDEESPPDFKESFSIGPTDAPDDDYHRAAKPGKFFAPNFWPQQPANFRPVWGAYYHHFQRVALPGAAKGAAAGSATRRGAHRLRQPDHFEARQRTGRPSGVKQGGQLDRRANLARNLRRQPRRPYG